MSQCLVETEYEITALVLTGGKTKLKPLEGVRKASWLEDLTVATKRQRNEANHVFTCLDGGLFILIV